MIAPKEDKFEKCAKDKAVLHNRLPQQTCIVAIMSNCLDTTENPGECTPSEKGGPRPVGHSAAPLMGRCARQHSSTDWLDGFGIAHSGLE